MVKYWLPYCDVLASGWVNSGPEILPEKLGTVLEKNITTAGFVDKLKLVFGGTPL